MEIKTEVRDGGIEKKNRKRKGYLVASGKGK